MQEWLIVAVDAIGKVPATFWGVIVGAAFSLIGVHLTNRASEKRAAKDREFQARKEICLALSETIYGGFLALGKLPNTNIPDQEITKEFLDRAVTVGGVHIFARLETIESLSHLLCKLQATFSLLTLDRFSLMNLKHELEQLEAKGSLEDAAAVRLALSQQTMLYASKCVGEAARLNGDFAKLVVALRNELGSSIDQNRCYALMSDVSIRLEAVMNDLTHRASAWAAEPDALYRGKCST